MSDSTCSGTDYSLRILCYIKSEFSSAHMARITIFFQSSLNVKQSNKETHRNHDRVKEEAYSDYIFVSKMKLSLYWVALKSSHENSCYSQDFTVGQIVESILENGFLNTILSS